uniref:Uncharacterized protein n=1 Tax=Arundo donax TaxID=35708 RepID=A0A0A8Y7U9_ARUDO
MLEQIRKIV